ncbi:MAG: saccharopine dehydrogenase NADP-binding domain-containing protein [Rhizobiaceae bacterium]|nr:saccharopine dehydrogenase NADP-binding domain-containing protein [Rhizobiaceae bacterium]
MTTIHWIGTGLSSIPGLTKLIKDDHNVVVWNRTLATAQAALAGLDADIRAFDIDVFADALSEGDIAVSMLPGDWHVPIAVKCISNNANFVSSSYISPEMRDLSSTAREKGLCFVNEVGLDPGIDHLMAHWLVDDYRKSDAYNADNELSFVSYCGGVPKIANDFRYKFSWSPLGVLKALRSPSKSIKNFEPFDVARPWDAISTFDAPLAENEAFEVYPNRDSLPFIEDYKFDADWKVKQFVRGTLRLNGWAKAWDHLFKEIETLSGAEGDARLKQISDELLAQHSYDEKEPDRVVLCVSLKAEDASGEAVYHKTYSLDAHGNEHGSAMAQLVSITVALAVQSVMNNEIDAGVSAAPSSLPIVSNWMREIEKIAQYVEIKNLAK